MKDSSSRFFAPVILFVYNRLDYTQQTVNALKNNTLSKDTELIVFSDGGKDTKTWHEVNQLRAYLHTVTGFKSVTIVEREVNYYLERNIIEGVTEIINKFGRAIVLEDDVITSPYFLEYMNDALTIYEKEKKVMHISSINHFAINIESDALFTSFMECGWGWATWADRWSLFKYFKSKSDAVRDLSDSDLNRIEYGGRFNCLKSLDADPIPWDICWTIAIYKNKGICLEPKIPLTQNIGLYNGTHLSLIHI